MLGSSKSSAILPATAKLLPSRAIGNTTMPQGSRAQTSQAQKATGLDKIGQYDGRKILTLSPKLFLPHRLLVLDILYRFGYADFRELKHALGTTDGNLASHLRALEHEGYVRVDKVIIDRRPRSTYFLTDQGHAACDLLKQYLDRLFNHAIKG